MEYEYKDIEISNFDQHRNKIYKVSRYLDTYYEYCGGNCQIHRTY